MTRKRRRKRSNHIFLTKNLNTVSILTANVNVIQQVAPSKDINLIKSLTTLEIFLGVRVLCMISVVDRFP